MGFISKISFKRKRCLVKICSVLKAVLKVLNTVIISVFCLFALYLGVRIFLFDEFCVPTSSMEPTIIPGDHILLNKSLFGARLYKHLNFKDGVVPGMFRLKGLRMIKYNDIVVFNYPYPKGGKKGIKFSLKKVYVKRCVGLPGDTLKIEGGIIYSSGCRDTIGYYPNEERLHKIQLSPAVKRSLHRGIHNIRWTILDLGPLFIPAAGSTVSLDSMNYRLYEAVIKYESGKSYKYKDGRILLGGIPVSSYTFQQNYYFMCGDNYADSRDSRYWGFLPEKFIMGVSRRILYSRDNYSGTFRWSRFFKKMK